MKKVDDIKQTIKEISEKTKLNLRLTDLLNSITEEANKFLKCDSCTIWIYNVNNKNLLLSGASEKHRNGIGEHCYVEGEEFITWDVFIDRKMKVIDKNNQVNGLWIGKYIDFIYPKKKSKGVPFLGLPIKLHNQIIGVLTFTVENPEYVFKNESQSFAKIISDEIAITVDDINRHIETNVLSTHRREKLEFLRKFSRELLMCTNLDDIYKLTCEKTRNRLNCRTSSIFMFSKEGKLERKYIDGFKNKINEPPIETYEREQGLVGKSVGRADQFGKSYISDNYEEESFIEKDSKIIEYIENYKISFKKDSGIKEKIKHVVTIPLNTYNRATGVIRIVNKID